MSVRNEIRQMVINAIISAGTSADRNVFGPRDIPTRSDTLPAVLVHAPSSRKESVARGIPQFTTTVTVTVTGRVEAASANEAQAQIEQLADDIEVAVLTDFTLVRETQQFTSVDDAIRVSSEGAKHVGECEFTFAVETYEVFDPIEKAPQRIDPDTGALESPASVPLETVTVGINTDNPGQPEAYLEFDNLQS